MISSENQKIALVTGGTGGLGRAVSLALLEKGYLVAVTYRAPTDWEALQNAAAARKGALEGFSVDVTDETDVKGLIANLVEKHGRVDTLVNTVGGYAGGIKLWELDSKVLENMIALNLRSGFALTKAVVPVMLKQKAGAIVNVAAKA